MSDQKKKVKLNINAKALFLRNIAYTIKCGCKKRCTVSEHGYRSANYYLNYLKISKGFLLSANLHQVYALTLRGIFGSKYSAQIGNSNDTIIEGQSDVFRPSFEDLQKLSKWVRFDSLNLEFSFLCGENEINRRIAAFKRVCDDIYPEAKINLICGEVFNSSNTLPLLKEWHERLHDLECESSAFCMAPMELNLNSCVLITDIDIVSLKKAIKRHQHKIKKFEFNLTKMKSNPVWTFNPDLIPQEVLSDFPTNPFTKRLEIGHRTKEMNDWNLDKAISLLPYFPNLTSFCLNFEVEYDLAYEKAIRIKFLKMKRTTSDALDHIRELRLKIHEQKPELKLELISSLTIELVDTSIEKFNKWTKTLLKHPELADAVRIEPAFELDSSGRFTLHGQRSWKSVEKEDHCYKYSNDCHVLRLKWEHENFIGTININAENYKKRKRRAVD